MKIDKMEEAKKELIRVHGIYKNSMDAFRGYILNGELNVRVVSSHIFELNILALHAWYIEGDKNKAKNYWYIAGLCAVYGAEEFDKIYGFNEFGNILMSDRLDLVRLMSNDIEKKMEVNNDSAHSYAANALIDVSIVGMRYYYYSNRIEDMLRYISRGHENMKNRAKQDYIFFEGVLENDKQKCESAITELLTPKVHRHRNQHFVVQNNFMSYPAAEFVKLSWYLGMNVEVDHPMIPMELMPIERIEYDLPEGYEFLKELHEKVK